MQIYGLQVMGPWVLLAVPPETVTLQPGQTLRVHLSFNYKYQAIEPITVTLHGFIGTRQADGTFRSVADGAVEVALAPSTEFTPWEGAVDIPTGAGLWGIGATPAGTYDLLVRLDEFPEVSAEVSGAVDIVTGAADMSGMMGMVMMLMKMGMVVPMVSEGMAEGAAAGGV
jgi:hypothetical protein